MLEGTTSSRVRCNVVVDRNALANLIKVYDFIAATKNAAFNSEQAINMLQTRYTLDFRSRKAGSRAASNVNNYIYVFYLDLIIIIRRLLKPITQPSGRFFDNIYISFKNWRAPYSAKHVHGLSFNLEHKTF